MIVSGIAGVDDVARIEARPYADFMPHSSVFDALAHAARCHAGRRALTFITTANPHEEAQSWTHSQFIAQVRRAANLFVRLTHSNVPGDAEAQVPRIAMLLPAIPQAYFTLFGAETAGIVCPINYLLGADHVAELLRASKANILVTLGPNPQLDIWSRVPQLRQTCPDLRHVLAVGGGTPQGAVDFDNALAAEQGDTLDHPQQVDSRRLAALFHTGGTTGRPKLAQHTHGNQLHAAWSAAQLYASTPHDVILNGFPLFHVAGAFVFGLATLLTGGEVVLPTLLGMRHKAFVDRYWTFVERHGVSLLAAVPTVMATLLDVPPGNAQLGGVRALLTGGSPLPQELAAGFERRFHIKVRNILGMTECAGVIAIEPWLASRVPGSCGLRLPFTQIHAAGENGQALAAGETGVLCVKGPNVGPGYTESERNAGTFTDDGWLITGDVGYVDDKGLVFITGRAKDLIIRSSHNIDPRVIEDALLRHPDVIMAAAVGEPDEYAGEIPVAFVVLRPGSMAQPQELADFAQPLIPERPAFPKRVEVLPALPLTAIGKIYKPALKAMAIRHAIAQRLAQAGLAARVSVDVVDEGVRQTVVFNVNDAAPRDALVGELGQLMSRFAIHYRVVG